MDAIIDVVAQILVLGSAALLVWGAILTVGQLIRSGRERQTADAAGASGADRRGAPRAASASTRRRRFSRLAPPA